MCASTPGSLLVIPQQISSADSYHPIQLSEFEKQKKGMTVPLFKFISFVSKKTESLYSTVGIV